MDCPKCGARAVTFSVPEELRKHAPGTGEHAALCSRCLAVSPAETGGGNLQTVSEAFPPDGRGAAACALAIGKLEALALNRNDIRELLEFAEREGADPLLLLDRLGAQGSIQAQFDIGRRRTQLEQLL